MTCATRVMFTVHVCNKNCVYVTHLVVSEGHVAAHTLLHTHVSKVTVPLATGLRKHLIVVEEPEETLLKVLGAAHAAAVKLDRGTQQGVRRFGSEPSGD